MPPKRQENKTVLGPKTEQTKYWILNLLLPSVTVLMTIVSKFGYPFLLSVPTAALLLWPRYLLRPRGSTEEFSFLQSIRALAYVVAIVVLVPLNALVVTPSNPLSLALTPAVAFVLAILLIAGTRHYKEEVTLLDHSQYVQYGEMLQNVGITAIWISAAIGATYYLVETSTSYVAALLSDVVALLMGYVAVRYEIKSANIARRLSMSLQETRTFAKAKNRKRRAAKKR